MTDLRVTAGARTLAARCVALALVIGFGGLGACWAIDRARTWQTPRWIPARFVALRRSRAGAGS